MKKETLQTDSSIRTYSGIYFDVLNPTLEMVNIEDIAHSLSMQCRWGGHIEKFYSVSQHSILCSKMVSRKNALAALLHDASEAYLIDIPRPVKRHLKNYGEIEYSIMSIIAEKFNFEFPFLDEIKEADDLLLHYEWETFILKKQPYGSADVFCSPIVSKALFLKTFDEVKKRF